MSTSLQGRVALVTGAGRGIGRAHSMLLAERGARVVVCDLGVELDGSGSDTSVAQTVADEIVAAGGTAVAGQVDISTFAGGEQAVAVALDAFGGLDIVVNNAGLGGAGGDDAEAALMRTLAVNFVGTVAVTRAAWASLAASGRGRVINTVSEAAWPNVASPNVRQEGVARVEGDAVASFVGYGSAKAAVWSATYTLAGAGVPYGITVNAISPGAFTRMNEAMFRAQAPPPGLDLDPMHVARVAAWLASDDAADVTGKVIHAAGGQHREYLITRVRDSELMTRVSAAIGPA